jgi:hypothetical protein
VLFRKVLPDPLPLLIAQTQRMNIACPDPIALFLNRIQSTRRNIAQISRRPTPTGKIALVSTLK